MKRNPGFTSFSPSLKLPQQEQRIKELEGQVNLLISFATHKKAAAQPIAPIGGETINTIGNPNADQQYQCSELKKVNSDILVAIDARFEQNAPRRSMNRFRQSRPMNAPGIETYEQRMVSLSIAIACGLDISHAIVENINSTQTTKTNVLSTAFHLQDLEMTLRPALI